MGELNIRAQEMRSDQAMKLQELQLQKEIAILTLAQKTNQSLAQIKADLAATVINTNTQRELKAQELALQQMQTSQEAAEEPPSSEGTSPGPFDQEGAPSPQTSEGPDQASAQAQQGAPANGNP